MRPNSRKHDPFAPHVRAAESVPTVPTGRVPAESTPGPARARSGAQGRKRRANRRAAATTATPSHLTEQPQVRSAVEAALAHDDSTAVADV